MKNVLILTMLLCTAACETIEPGFTGVEIDWSRVTGKTYGEGFHTVGPAVDLHPMSIRMQNLEETDVSCRSKDNVGVLVDVTVSYTLDRASAAKVYKQLGDEYANSVVMPATRSTVRDAVAGVEALQVAQARGTLEEAIATALRSSVARTLRSQRLPATAIRIDSVQLRNADLPRSLTSSIESIQRQENQGRERGAALRTAQQEAARQRAEAEGRNAVAILNAEGQARVRAIDGESQAAFNRQLSASLTPGLIELRRIEAQRAITANPNAHLVVLGGGDGNGSGGSPLVIQAPR
jgi:regulator of protease activity HflC (stomatin/prohibitin superfamily)